MSQKKLTNTQKSVIPPTWKKNFTKTQPTEEDDESKDPTYVLPEDDDSDSFYEDDDYFSDFFEEEENPYAGGFTDSEDEYDYDNDYY